MDPTVSISKGVFVFNADKQRSKHSKKADFDTNIFADQLWYKSYKTLWTDLEIKLEVLHNNLFSSMLGNSVLFVRKAYEHRVDEIPTAALLTGVNMPDHEEQFRTLARELKIQVTPHVVCLSPQNCSSVKGLVENVVNMFVNNANVGYDDDLSDAEDEKQKIRKINCNFPLLQSWYNDLYGHTTKKRVKKSPSKPLVVIIPEVEGFNDKALQDFILIASSYLNDLPFVLIFGIATSLPALHKSLPYHVSSKINIRVFSSQPSTLYLNSVLEHVFFNEACPFHLGGKVFSLFTDIFLFYDLSVTGFIKNIKYALLEHFSNGNAMALCTSLKNVVQVLEVFTHGDFEEVRRLLSFRKFVESAPLEDRLRLLTDDKFFKNVLIEQMTSFHEYLYVFHVFLELLHILVHDLPKSPLGKHVREIYALAATKDVTISEEHRDAFQFLGFQSKTELSEKVSKMASFLEDELRKKPKFHDDLDAFLEQLNVYVNNLESVAENVTEPDEVEKEMETFSNKMDRQKLKNKLLQHSKRTKPLNKYEKLRTELLEFLTNAFKQHLQPPFSKPFHEIFFFDDISVQNHIIGSHRAAIHTALNDPHSYLQCPCCEIPNDAVILRTMPDICIAYKLHLECGKLINLYDWLQSFLTIVDPVGAEDDEKRIVKPELQARFTQAVAELEYLGFIKSSKRKTDHVMRLTWGG